MQCPAIALTIGDVAGIGPEIVVRALHCPTVRAACRPIVIGHRDILRRAAAVCGLDEALDFVDGPPITTSADELRPFLDRQDAGSSSRILCINPAGDAALAAKPGLVSPAAGDAAFQYLTAAISLARRGIVAAIVTAPLNKAALHAAGHNFPGHTEILAQQCGVSDFAMMLHLPESRISPLRQLVRNCADGLQEASSGLSIAHVTLHTSIRSVPDLLSTDGVARKIRLMQGFLKQIGCQRQAIGVCALNPHGGEQGLFGTAESRVIEPAVQLFRGADGPVLGPIPADTLIRRAVAGEFDGVIAMYHDQGHIPVKLIGFDAAVNITLGLPIVRTSPTHGTAFDRAWDRNLPADAAGMIEAVLTAAKLSRQSAPSAVSG